MRTGISLSRKLLGRLAYPTRLATVNQVNAVIPAGVTPGDTVSIVIEVDCGGGNVFRSRDDVTIAVDPAL